MRSRSPLSDTQAGRILDRFGGVLPAWKAFQVLKDLYRVPSHPSIMYRWTYPPARNGTGGLIPRSMVPVVLAAARVNGIELTADDWFPRTIGLDGE